MRYRFLSPSEAATPMNLNRYLIERTANDYEEQYFEEELEQLEALPPAFESGDWTIADLEWILKWKVGVAFEKPILRYFHSNTDEQIKTTINQVINTRDVVSKVEHLTTLKGVGVPVASAILLYINPERFTVIDERAWRTLRETGYLDQDLSEDPTIEEYLLYLGACWALANEYDVSLRTLDMALWALGAKE